MLHLAADRANCLAGYLEEEKKILDLLNSNKLKGQNASALFELAMRDLQPVKGAFSRCVNLTFKSGLYIFYLYY